MKFINSLRTVLVTILQDAGTVPFLISPPNTESIHKLCELTNTQFADPKRPVPFRVFPVSVNKTQDVCVVSIEQWEYLLANSSGGDDANLSAMYDCRIDFGEIA